MIQQNSNFVVDILTKQDLSPNSSSLNFNSQSIIGGVISSKVGRKQNGGNKTLKSKSRSAGKTPRQGSKKKTGNIDKHLAELEAYRAYNVERKQAVNEKFGHQQDIVGRFGELGLKMCQENGKSILYNVDMLKETKIDPKVGGLVLEFMSRANKISLWSDFCDRTQTSLQTYYQTYVAGGKADPAAKAIEGKDKKLSHSYVELFNIMKGLQQSMTQGYVKELQIVKLRPDANGWNQLVQGLKHTKSLLLLQINNCELNKQALDLIAEGVKSNSSLKILDLSFCAIPDSCASSVIRLIQEQGELRDQNVWQSSLREQKQQTTNLSKVQSLVQMKREVEGLPEFIFHHNLLGTQFMKGLTKLVGLDRYCRKLDLRYNRLSEAMITEEYFKCFHCNETIINLDIRENSDVSRDSLRKVALVLLRNIETAKKSQILLCHGWLDRGVLMLTKQQWPALVRGLNILIKHDEETDGSNAKLNQNNIFSDTSTIDLQVKSLKGNRLSAKTRSKPRKLLEQSSEMDMFNSKLLSQTKKSLKTILNASTKDSQKASKSGNSQEKLKNVRSNPQTKKTGSAVFDIKNSTEEKYDTGTFKQLPRLREPTPDQDATQQQQNPNCNKCQSFQQKYLQSEQQRLELQQEVSRLTAKIDNIRRLQEAGVLKSHENKQVLASFGGQENGGISMNVIEGRGPKIGKKGQATEIKEQLSIYAGKMHQLIDVIENN